MAQRTATRGAWIFGTLWLGQIASLIGSGLTGFALGVWVYQQTGSVTQFALISLFVTLPSVLIAPLAGALVDRWDRRWVMILSDAAAALGTLVIALLLFGGRLQVWHIYLVTATGSVFAAFQWPAYSASITLLIPKQHYGRTSGMVQLGQAIARIIAPVLAGVLVELIQIRGVILIDLATCLFALLTLLIVRIPKPDTTAEGKVGRGSLLSETAYGWIYLVARPGLLGLLIFFAVANFSVCIVQVLITPLVLSFASAAVLGTVLSTAGSGMLVGGIVMSLWGGPKRRIYGIFGFVLLQGVILFVGGLQPNASLIASAAFVFLFSNAIVNGCSQAIWQSKVAPDVQGRVFAMRGMVASSTVPLAYLVAGPLADNVFEPLMAADGPLAGSVGQLIGTGPGRGIGLLFVVLGSLIVLATIAGFIYPRLRRVEEELPDAIDDQPRPETRDEVTKNEIPGARTRTDSTISFATFLLITLLVLLGIHQLMPPDPVPLSAPLAEFSSARALKHLEVIAQQPHPIGSPGQAEVRNYILKELTAMGLEPEVQIATGLNRMWGPPFQAGTVHNIVARIEGTDNTKAVLLMAHYDSVPTGPGASDDGASVVTILETARALGEDSPLKNDVILLFTDGEEVGLLGAAAFVDEHPWAQDVGLVMNFEARGIRGPSIMFETSAENGWLIKEFATAVPHPVANSLAYEVYKLLPNDTDFTVFQRAGLAGFNLAFIEGGVYYHTPHDSIQNIDERSLQHHGTYALALTRHFGNLPLGDAREPNEIYFDILGSVLVHYPGTWAIPLMVLAVLTFAGIMVLGFRRGKLTFSKTAMGTLSFLLNMLVAPVTVTLVWQMIRALHSEYRALPWGNTYNGNLYMMAFVAMTAAIVSLVYAGLRSKISTGNLAVGALLWWLILAVLTSLFLPGVSYLFTWPLLFSLIGLGFTFVAQDHASTPVKRFVLLSICAAPGIILLTPTIYLIFVAVSLAMSGVVMLLVVLQIGLLVPHLDLMAARNKWWLPVACALASLGLMAAGSLTSTFDADRPKPNSLFYALNADTNKAIWASVDEKPDRWTWQFVSADAPRGSLPEFFPLWSQEFLRGPAPPISLPAPDLVLLDDYTSDGIRTLHTRITSPRQASSIGVYITSKTRVLEAVVNGKQISRSQTPTQMEVEQEGQWGLLYEALPKEGIELVLRIEPSHSVEIRVVDQSFGFPEMPEVHFEARSEDMMAVPFPLVSDLILVSRTATY